MADELSIYGQGQSTGILYVDQPLGYNHTFMSIFANNLTINGGKVYAFGMSESDATSAEGLAVLATADININGGLFQALTNLFEKGIYANGNITLGWRLPTDAITVRGYRFGGDLIVKPGQSFINPTGDILTGSLIGKASSMFDGRTLSPCYAVNFDANGGNFSGETSVLCATQFDSNGDAHVSAPATDPTRDGYTFGGWKLGEDDFDFTAAVTSNLTLKAYWTGTTNVTFAKEGYGTYYNSSEDVVLPAGMKAYIVTASSDGGSLTYEVIADGDQTDAATAVVPKATAVMLQTAASTSTQSKDVTLASPTDTRDFSDASGNADGWVNMLHGSDAAVETTGGDKYYKLTYNRDGSEKVLGWYWGGDEGAAFGSAAHKAWLALPESASFARGFFGLPGDGETTGICPAEIKEMAERAGVWYPLDGRKLDGKPSAKGVYIVNGKKVVIKDSRSAFTKCND
ncbi:MAG: InlB B-repeat-containing protein [Bacteroidales bacterium]|nr:InlB B-repeat-containing protein [Bacteroidales bacterium]